MRFNRSGYKLATLAVILLLSSHLALNLYDRVPTSRGDALLFLLALGLALFSGMVLVYRLTSLLRKRVADHPDLFPETCPDPIMRLGADGHLLYANPASFSLLDSMELPTGSGPAALLPPELAKKLAILRMDGRGKMTWVYPVGNRYLQCMIHSVPVHHYHHAYLSDITQRKNFEKNLYFQATHDILTALPNRRMLIADLEQRLQRASEPDDSFALMSISLDRLKMISGSQGYMIGEKLVREVAARFDDVVRSHSEMPGNFCLYQLDNADFAVLVNRYPNRSALSRLANLYMKSMEEPFYIGRREYFSSISIGISAFPADGSDASTLMRNADVARRCAVDQHGSSGLFYNSDMADSDSRTLVVENHLRHALERDEFELFYQPQLCLKSNRITGMEAVLRWNHPQHGRIPPENFIPVAEETGMISPITHWVLQNACNQTRLWQEQGLTGLRVAVNISRRQFHQRNFLRQIESALQKSGMQPGFLELEITETAVLQGFKETHALLVELRNRGILLSIDDFGTGWSSLGFLKDFPVDAIKIDQSFVQNLSTDSFNAAICKSVIELGHSQNLNVIAEGVETREQKDWLQQQHCDHIQGYFCSKPLTAEEFRNFVYTRNHGNVQSIR